MYTAHTRRKKYTLPEKPLRLTLNIARWVLVALTAAATLFLIFTAAVFNREDRGFFGKNCFVIINEFMEPGIENGSVVITEKAADYYPGDTIVFKSIAPEHYGEYTVRRVRDKIIHGDRAAYITYPNSSGMDDFYPAYADDVVGKVTSAVEGLGSFYGFVKSPAGYLLTVLFPFMLLIAEEFVRHFLFGGQKQAAAQRPTYTTAAHFAAPPVVPPRPSVYTADASTAQSDAVQKNRDLRTYRPSTGSAGNAADDDQPTRMISSVRPAVNTVKNDK